MSSAGPLSRQPSRSPSRLSPTPGPAPGERSLCPKSAGLAPSGRRAGETRLVGSKRETFLWFSVAPTPTPCSGSERRLRGAARAPPLPGRGQRPAQHVAHVSVPLPTPSRRCRLDGAPVLSVRLPSASASLPPTSPLPVFHNIRDAPSQFLISSSVPTSELSTFRALENVMPGVSWGNRGMSRCFTRYVSFRKVMSLLLIAGL